MKYEKPELLVVESATGAIQHLEKGPDAPPDGPESRTIGAYQADE
ncbi:MAG: hypothetical protein WCA00_11320 [Candidatus Acidiferrales bacterium]